MINKEDPLEWIKQIELSPVSAPGIAKVLISRLENLDSTNEELRNENLELRRKIDTKAHQKETEELQRQIKALGRLMERQLVKKENDSVIVAWTSQGFVLALDWRKVEVGKTILLPRYEKLLSQRIRLLSAPLAEDILFITNLGRVGFFEIRPLVELCNTKLAWHKLPDLSLAEKEFISIMTPIGMLPISNSLVTLSEEGYARSIHRLYVNQFLQNGQVGKGIKNEQDVQVFANLIIDKQSDIIIFTSEGNYLRFSFANIPPSATQSLKLDISDRVIGMVSTEQSCSQVLFVDSSGKCMRRSIDSFVKTNMGIKPKSALSGEEMIGVQPISDTDRVVMLFGREQIHMTTLKAIEIPLNDQKRSLVKLREITGSVYDFVTMRE